MEYKVEIIHSKRRTLSLEIKPDGKIIARAPRLMSKSSIDAFVASKQDWIAKQLDKMQRIRHQELNVQKLTDEELSALTNQAKEYIPKRVKYFARQMGVEYNRITIRHQQSRWGSCSSKKNLNFNCLLMLAPLETIDAVVVHELCHLKEMNHSQAFYDLVLEYFPNYHKHNKWLKDNGRQLLMRLK